MNELLSQLWTPELQMAFTAVLVLLAVLYVLSIIWVVRDAYLRGTVWYLWAIIALVPLAGVISYCLLRPPLLQIDRDEQELEIALKQRQLMQYGECATCGYPVERDFVLCPGCHQRLKNLCAVCNHALDPTWKLCPYCTTPVGMAAPVSIPSPASAPAAALPRRGVTRQQRSAQIASSSQAASASDARIPATQSKAAKATSRAKTPPTTQAQSRSQSAPSNDRPNRR